MEEVKKDGLPEAGNNQGEAGNTANTAGQEGVAQPKKNLKEQLESGDISQSEFDEIVKDRLNRKGKEFDREKQYYLDENERLKKKLEEATKAQAPKEPELVRPVRPKQADYVDKTQEEYESDLQKYDDDFIAYTEKLTEAKMAKAIETVKKDSVKPEENEIAKNIASQRQQFDSGVADIKTEHGDDAEEVIDTNLNYALKVFAANPVILAAIHNSPTPAHILYDSEFIESLSGMDAYQAIKKIGVYEEKIMNKKNASPKKETEPKKRPPVVTPVKPSGGGNSGKTKTPGEWAEIMRAEARARAGK